MLSLLTRNWWTLALRGSAAVLFGILALVWPGIVADVLVVLFGAYVAIDGVLGIIAAVRARRTHPQWWIVLLRGVGGLAFGIVAFGWPRATALVLLLFIAAWAIVTGVFEILAAIVLRRELKGEWLLILSGALSLLIGAILALQPRAGSIALVWLIGVYAILAGVVLIVLAIRLRAIRRTTQILSGP